MDVADSIGRHFEPMWALLAVILEQVVLAAILDRYGFYNY